MARLRYSVSFYAAIDFLAVFPYYLARLSPAVDRYDNYLRLLRLLRILKVPVMRCVNGGVLLICKGWGGYIRLLDRRRRDTVGVPSCCYCWSVVESPCLDLWTARVES